MNGGKKNRLHDNIIDNDGEDDDDGSKIMLKSKKLNQDVKPSIDTDIPVFLQPFKVDRVSSPDSKRQILNTTPFNGGTNNSGQDDILDFSGDFSPEKGLQQGFKKDLVRNRNNNTNANTNKNNNFKEPNDDAIHSFYTESSENSAQGKKNVINVKDEPATTPSKKNGRRGGEMRKKFAGYNFFIFFHIFYLRK